MTDSTDNARPLGPWQAFPSTRADLSAPSPDVLALVEALIRIEDMTQHDMGMTAAEERVIHFEAQSALAIHRAARAALSPTGGNADG